MAKLIQIPDISRLSYPFLIYKRVGLIYDPMPLVVEFDPGCDFRLYRVSAKWSSVNPAIPLTVATPIRIAFFKDAGSKALQSNPFDLSLMSSPAESGVVVNFTNAARPMSARPLNTDKTMNALFYFRDCMRMEISGITSITIPGDPDGSLPSYLDLLFIGRQYPRTSQEAWQR